MPRNLTFLAGCLLTAVLACVCALESQVKSAQEPDGEKYVFKSESPLVVLDVVVTHKKGQPVHGLKPSDFTELERDQKITLQSFEEHRADQVPSPAALPAQQPLGPNVFTNITDMRSNGPLNVLLIRGQAPRPADGGIFCSYDADQHTDRTDPGGPRFEELAGRDSKG